MRRYPRVTSHLIADSLGYFTPSGAALFIRDAKTTKKSFCEWCLHSYGGDAVLALRTAIRYRHVHKGFMGDYRRARAIVEQAIRTGGEPVLASWF